MKTYLSAVVLTLIFAACSDKNKDELGGAGGRGDNTYFKIAVDGVDRELDVIHYARTGKNLHLATYNDDGFPNLNVTFTTRTEDDFRATYNYSYDLSAGTSIILYSDAQAGGFESHWWDCPPDAPLLVPSPGSLKIDNIERSNGDEYVTGSFSVEVYQPQGDCPYAEIKTKKITAKFRLKRAR